MRMPAALLAAALMLWMGILGATPLQLPARDFRNGRDHPIVSRFDGAVILGYEAKDYDALIMPLGKYVGYREPVEARFSKSKTVEGKLTRIAYGIPRGKTTIEIFRNYQQALANAGFEVPFTCVGSSCGEPYEFLDTLRDGLLNAGLAYDNELNWMINAIGGDLRHLSAVLHRPAGDVYVTVSVAQSPEQPPGVLVRIAETQPMQTGQVTVDAQAIAETLRSDGRIALYGISFDTDSSTLKPESTSTLAEMAKYLKANAISKAYIVGHTDSTASLAHNLNLSQQRAEAVVKVLVTQYGISTERLSARGLASYAPVASNRDEAGRAKNRRVEMVEQ